MPLKSNHKTHDKLNLDESFILWYPISLLMAKTAPPCLSRDPGDHALWHPEAWKAQPRPALALAFGLHGFLGVFGLEIISVNCNFIMYLIFLSFKKKQRKLFQEICTSSVFFLCCSYHNYTLHLPRPIQNTLVSCKQMNWDTLCNAIGEAKGSSTQSRSELATQ